MDRPPSSYNPNAPLPRNGTRWIWEIDQPHARALIEVVDTIWNGEEWWVTTRTLLPRAERFPGDPEPLHHNDLSRFWEACLPVLPKIAGRMDTFTERRPPTDPEPALTEGRT